MQLSQTISLVEILNPLDERVETVLQRAGVTLGEQTVFGEVVGVSANQRLVIFDVESQCHMEYEI